MPNALEHSHPQRILCESVRAQPLQEWLVVHCRDQHIAAAAQDQNSLSTEAGCRLRGSVELGDCEEKMRGEVRGGEGNVRSLGAVGDESGVGGASDDGDANRDARVYIIGDNVSRSRTRPISSQYWRPHPERGTLGGHQSGWRRHALCHTCPREWHGGASSVSYSWTCDNRKKWPRCAKWRFLLDAPHVHRMRHVTIGPGEVCVLVDETSAVVDVIEGNDDKVIVGGFPFVVQVSKLVAEGVKVACITFPENKDILGFPEFTFHCSRPKTLSRIPATTTSVLEIHVICDYRFQQPQQQNNLLDDMTTPSTTGNYPSVPATPTATTAAYQFQRSDFTFLPQLAQILERLEQGQDLVEIGRGVSILPL
ncbi:hypothetical protein BC937DRAFT_88557 [Endogone sp. FLAS-F59071]|nr:hypothetical protein BC937DRAFT_88557 [Endogone sp. FLAS-F59071]|eukprot:RUS18608.1 hypothetical protein BC937DRAFT_88557 [Endogone sp. FLAS-F59071]